MTVLVTGGAGFIGSSFVEDWLATTRERIVVLDKLTYAGNLDNLGAPRDVRLSFAHGDVVDRPFVRDLFARVRPRALVHFAAESHVDRSIHAPDEFVRTNVLGTFSLLEEARAYVAGDRDRDGDGDARRAFRFVHVSTDEVFGSLAPDAPAFTESCAYAPNSPYSASKAASDHFVRAYHHTYGLATLTTHCSNNYGPRQFPEKLIPLIIASALAGRPLPIYGDGQNVRDWLYVGDHCRALREVLERGTPGETYGIGGSSERTNVDVVRTVCRALDELAPAARGRHEDRITFVADRPGHDRRYAIDTTKIHRELGWTPSETFASGIRKTVEWYLANGPWMERVQTGAYRDWLVQQYAAR
jgi:dTDP-glucose 4,6-dehydratase